MRAGEAAFGEEPREGEFERMKQMLPHDRWLVAYDDGRPVGTTTSHRVSPHSPGWRAGGRRRDLGRSSAEP